MSLALPEQVRAPSVLTLQAAVGWGIPQRKSRASHLVSAVLLRELCRAWALVRVQIQVPELALALAQPVRVQVLVWVFLARS